MCVPISTRRQRSFFYDFHIKKTVYSPGVMKLYYRGGQFKDTPTRCYDANFEDLEDQF